MMIMNYGADFVESVERLSTYEDIIVYEKSYCLAFGFVILFIRTDLGKLLHWITYVLCIVVG